MAAVKMQNFLFGDSNKTMLVGQFCILLHRVSSWCF